jgi:predicted amidohydrolase
MNANVPSLVDARGLIRAAVVQVNATEDVQANVAAALELVGQAAARGARLVVLPEKFTYLGRRAGLAAAVQPLEGPLLAPFAGAARQHGLFLVAGSVWEEVPGERRTYNTSVLFGPDGTRLAYYRKIHMFDVEVGGQTYRESEDCRPGDRVVAVELPGPTGSAAAPGGATVVLGLTVCYDLRFPELYRALADLGARIVAVASGFTMQTGRDHWELLVRARAVENQVYVVAANQTGRHEPGRESYGRSMIVDPWGVVLAQAPDGPGLAIADLDLDRLERIRRTLPSLSNRSPLAYDNRVLARSEGGPTG